MQEQIPDGLQIVFISPCKYGMPGEVKTISYSTAQRLVLSGYAKEFMPDMTFPGAVLPVVQKPNGVLVSAICPTFNRRKYIPQSIDCFKAQTYENRELIIVDDGTQSCADLVPTDDPTIKYFRIEEKLTTGAKRNLCCEKASGEVIVHWDDDDWSAPTRIMDQVERLKDCGLSVVNYFDILYWNDMSKKLFRFHPSSLRCPHGATFAYTKAWWLKHPFEAIQVGEDTNFGRDAMSSKQIAWFPSSKNIVIRAHDQNTCQTANSMGSAYVPEIPAAELPKGFLEAPTVDGPTAPAESWDLFDTLVACRPFDRAGEHLDQLYPIAETIARVKPNDIVISDYYKEKWVEAGTVLHDVAGLNNEFFVTDGDKYSGAIWPGLRGRTVMHHGDHPVSDVQRPREAGILAEHITLSAATSTEQYLINEGMAGLGLACREARLRTWHPLFRKLQLLHISGNFPIITLAAVALHEFAEKHGVKVLLMSARDCCLWVDLQRDVCTRLGGHYEVEYFPSSRVVRNAPSPKYIEELNKRLDRGAAIVDVGGTGKSIVRLLQKSSKPSTPVFLIMKYPWTNIDGYGPINTDAITALTTVPEAALEDINIAQHGMYLDWAKTATNVIDWHREEIRVMHHAFQVARTALSLQPLPPYKKSVLECFIRSIPTLCDNRNLLGFMRDSLSQDDRIRVRFERPTGERDAVISVVRGHPWAHLAPYANSLVRSGFRGTKLMFIENVDAGTQQQLKKLGFVLMPFTTTNPARFVTRERFAPVVNYLNYCSQEFRNVIWTDVRDLIFQSDPSAWMEENMAPHRILGCSECLLIKQDPGYNTTWLNNSFPNSPEIRQMVREHEICCGGTIAGESEAIRDLMAKLYDMVCSSDGMNDQTALNYLLCTSPFKEMARVPRTDDGFTATCSWLFGRGNEIHGHELTDKVPFFDYATGTVLTPDKSKIFPIVHQYDREPKWRAIVERKFNR